MGRKESLSVKEWVEASAKLTQPDRIHWCDGSEEEYESMLQRALASGELIKLNEETYPGCFLHRSHPSDVARTEDLTFICSRDPEDAGPTNNWMSPEAGHSKVDSLFDGAMRGRTMYVVPYIMGPPASRYARCGVEITDSPYVVLNMRIMTRMGQKAKQTIAAMGTSKVVKGLHSTGDLDPNRRFIMHFPDESMIKSIGSGYGGNALLGKKCHSLRIASWQAREEGWLAEHMLIMGIEAPSGRTHYIAAAFPSACGKTNLAMLIPPQSFKGYKVWTVGDDICWMHLRDDGRLWAINPEAGFFGVAPGTSKATNPTAVAMLSRDTIFTNVAMTPDREPWWEGLTPQPPSDLIDWQGRPYDPSNGPAAHPNSRFTVAAKQCPSFSSQGNEPTGVPISAIVFGGRRADLMPLVFESYNWNHGVFAGASMASETTAAATGHVGTVRRDPMAMRPFCGYNMADYWEHWLSLGRKSRNLPKIFHVNWFRRGEDGRYLWPGYGENLRVLEWIMARCDERGDYRSTPIGYVPTASALNTTSLSIPEGDLHDLLTIDPKKWIREMDDLRDFFATFGKRLPKELGFERTRIQEELRVHDAN